jgi:hypothetical protein
MLGSQYEITLLLLTALTVSVGCSSGCKLYDEPVVTVNNAITGAPICDATITLRDEGSQDAGTAVLMPQVPPVGSPSQCQYVGIPTGTHTLVVARANFQTAVVPNVTVRVLPCDSKGTVFTREVRVSLTPS